MAKTRRKPKEKKAGRPPLADHEIRWSLRMDEETDQALYALAEIWNISRSEALRKAVKERARQEGARQRSPKSRGGS